MHSGELSFCGFPLLVVETQHLLMLRGGTHVLRGRIRSLCGGACRVSRFTECSYKGKKKHLTL